MAVTTMMPRPLSLAEADAVGVAAHDGYVTVRRGQRRAVAGHWRWCYAHRRPFIAVLERRTWGVVFVSTGPAGCPLDPETYRRVRGLIGEYRLAGRLSALTDFYVKMQLPIPRAHQLAERLAALLV